MTSFHKSVSTAKKDQEEKKNTAVSELEQFLLERRGARQPVDDLQKFERELHSLFAAAEAEVVGHELERFDIDLPFVTVDGIVHQRVLRCEDTYFCASGPVQVMRSLYSTRKESERAICPMELQAGLVEGRWTPHAAKQATWVVSHLTPGEVRRENGAFRYGLLARASGLDQLRYYGFGNETQNDEQDAFYRISDSQVTVFPTVSVGDGPKGSWTIGPIFRYSNTGRTRDDTLLAQEMPYGVGSFGEIGAASLYQLDTRAPDNVFSGGVSARLEGAVYPEAWDVESAFGSFGAELSGYIPLGSPALLSLNAGGRKVWGEVPFFEAAYIGGSHTTDGYHWNRFAGDASLYGSFELRWALRKIHFTVPGELGLTFRSDVGRVFLEREDSKRWHSSVSIAVFYAPFSGGSRSTSQTFDRASKRSLGLQAERLALFHADSCVDTEELPRTGDGPRLVFSRTSLL